MTATIKCYFCAAFVLFGLVWAVRQDLRSKLDVGSQSNLGSALRQAEQSAGVGK